MADVKTKLLNAFEVLKKEGKKISPFAVEKRAGVANGSCKNHPACIFRSIPTTHFGIIRSLISR